MSTLKVWTGRVFVVGLAPIISYFSRFSVNVILSRLLSPEEFGVALAITTVISLGSLTTDMALDRFVMVDKSPKALPTAHTLNIAKSLFVALTLVLIAPAAAALFGVAKFSESFIIAAGLSALGGFAHLRIQQILRNYEYGPQTIAAILTNAATVAAVFIAAIVLRNHNAIIVSSAVGAVVSVSLSHLLARSSYRLSVDRAVLRQAISFGLPLMLNGIGLAIIYQLDRVIVGYWLGVSELAAYAVIFSVSVMPGNMLLAIFSNLSLSYLLSGGEDPAERSERYRLLVVCFSVLASMYSLFMALSLDILTPFIFGASFTVSPLAHILFILIASLRLLRGGAPTVALLASGQTRRLAFLNLSSGMGLAVASSCLFVWPRFESMLIGLAIGELITCPLFFAMSDPVVKRWLKILTNLTITLSGVIFIVGALALNPAATWEARWTIFEIGLLVLSAQVCFELHRNKKIRGLFGRASEVNAAETV